MKTDGRLGVWRLPGSGPAARWPGRAARSRWRSLLACASKVRSSWASSARLRSRARGVVAIASAASGATALAGAGARHGARRALLAVRGTRRRRLCRLERTGRAPGRPAPCSRAFPPWAFRPLAACSTCRRTGWHGHCAAPAGSGRQAAHRSACRASRGARRFRPRSTGCSRAKAVERATLRPAHLPKETFDVVGMVAIGVDEHRLVLHPLVVGGGGDDGGVGPCSRRCRRWRSGPRTAARSRSTSTWFSVFTTAVRMRAMPPVVRRCTKATRAYISGLCSYFCRSAGAASDALIPGGRVLFLLLETRPGATVRRADVPVQVGGIGLDDAVEGCRVLRLHQRFAHLHDLNVHGPVVPLQVPGHLAGRDAFRRLLPQEQERQGLARRHGAAVELGAAQHRELLAALLGAARPPVSRPEPVVVVDGSAAWADLRLDAAPAPLGKVAGRRFVIGEDVVLDAEGARLTARAASGCELRQCACTGRC